MTNIRSKIPEPAYPNVLIFTFREGKIVQLVEVASAEMWSALQDAMRAVGHRPPRPG